MGHPCERNKEETLVGKTPEGVAVTDKNHSGYKEEGDNTQEQC